jgi:hypothetical protein
MLHHAWKHCLKNLFSPCTTSEIVKIKQNNNKGLRNNIKGEILPLKIRSLIRNSSQHVPGFTFKTNVL